MYRVEISFASIIYYVYNICIIACTAADFYQRAFAELLNLSLLLFTEYKKCKD